MTSLATIFGEHLSLAPARTAQEMTEIFRLRYSVYSKEVGLPGFEAWRFADGLETDEYDQRSVHYVMRHRPTGVLAGTVRLILADRNDITAPFPIEAFAGHAFDDPLSDIGQLPRATTAEISRLIIARPFRGRDLPGPSGTPDELCADVLGRRHLSPALLGLLAAIVRMSAANGITHWYAGMEPPLNRILHQVALRLRPIGPTVDYHGLRRPYLGVIDEVLAGSYRGNREVWELLTSHGSVWPPPCEHEQASAH